MLEGKNVNLRVFEKEDLPLLTDWYNDLEFFGEFVWLLQKSRMEREKWYDTLPSDAKLFFIEKKNSKKIGTIAHFLEGTLLEIGYFLVPSERGKGYCSEAAKMMVDYLFLSKDTVRVQAHTDVRNEASQKVLEKVGFARARIAKVGMRICWVCVFGGKVLSKCNKLLSILFFHLTFY